VDNALKIDTDISLSDLESIALNEISSSSTLDSIEKIRVKYLGKEGLITAQTKLVTLQPVEERKTFGMKVNQAKEKVASAISEKKQTLEAAALQEKLAKEFIDITIPARAENIGSIHPVSQVIEEITEIFAAMGFSVAEGPEIEDDYRNFTALNIPENHPARQMHDTFYVESGSVSDSDRNKKENSTATGTGTKHFVLRTHTSPVQIRTMETQKPPIKIIAPGRTFRCDSDQTHSPMFHQVEGLYIDENVNMGMLKGCLQEFVDTFFGVKNLKMRFRSSFFPFTEPSAEVDIGCSRKNGVIKIGEGTDWLEVMGCGMVHPNVLKNVGIDSTKYRGFAFGMGIERLAMLKYGISDLRQFFESDLRFLKHYSFSSFDVPKLSQGW
jgi:phenylalanyl-tRNA synthetase alpha chain